MWVKHTEQPEIQPFSDQTTFDPRVWAHQSTQRENLQHPLRKSNQQSVDPFPHDEIRPELWKVVDEIRVFARMTPQGKVGRVEGLGGTGWTSQTNDAAKC